MSQHMLTTIQNVHVNRYSADHNLTRRGQSMGTFVMVVKVATGVGIAELLPVVREPPQRNQDDKQGLNSIAHPIL